MERNLKDIIEQSLSKWFQVVIEKLKVNELSLRQIAKNLQRLSDILIGKREFEPYFNDENLLRSYASFFFPQNYIRTFFVLNDLLQVTDFLENNRSDISIMDLGSGIGASLLATLEIFNQYGVKIKRIEAIDSSLNAIEALSKIVPETPWEEIIKIKQVDLLKYKVTTKYDLILATTTFSEIKPLEPKFVKKVFSWVKPNGALVIIEPSWKKGFFLIRSIAVMIKRPLLLPCLNAEKCGMLDINEWCYASLDIKLPPFTLKVNQLFKHNLNYVKFTYGVFSEKLKIRIKPYARIISPVKKIKGKKVVRVCRVGEPFWVERLNRDRYPNNLELDQNEWGNIVFFESKELKQGWQRIEKEAPFLTTLSLYKIPS